MSKRDSDRLDRHAFSVGSLYEGSDEKAYWLTRSRLGRLGGSP